jgi:hypothetical protein
LALNPFLAPILAPIAFSYPAYWPLAMKLSEAGCRFRSIVGRVWVYICNVRLTVL